MNATCPAPDFPSALLRDLREHLAGCENALAIAADENRALKRAGAFQPSEFELPRKQVLARLDASLVRLRGWRAAWQQLGAADRERCPEAQPLMRRIQDLLLRVLLLDRENQQALLRRGLVTPEHLPLAASPQPPHYVANLYRRNAAAG